MLKGAIEKISQTNNKVCNFTNCIASFFCSSAQSASNSFQLTGEKQKYQAYIRFNYPKLRSSTDSIVIDQSIWIRYMNQQKSLVDVDNQNNDFLKQNDHFIHALNLQQSQYENISTVVSILEQDSTLEQSITE